VPRRSPFEVTLTADERQALESRAQKYTSSYCDVIRSKIILLDSEGLSNEVIARRLDTPRQIVSKWRKRFCWARLAGLAGQTRGRRKARFSPSLVVQVKAPACELPHRLGIPWSWLSIAEICQEVIAEGLVAEIVHGSRGSTCPEDVHPPRSSRNGKGAIFGASFLKN
jgi:transposase